MESTTKFNDLYQDFLTIPRVATFEQEEPSESGELVTKQVDINLIVLLPNRNMIIPDYMIISLIANYSIGRGKDITKVIKITDNKTSLFRKILKCVEDFLTGFKKTIYVNKINLASHMINDHLFKDEINNCGLIVVRNISKYPLQDCSSVFEKSIIVYDPGIKYIVEYDFKAQELILGDVPSLKKITHFSEYNKKISVDMSIEDLLFTKVAENMDKVFSEDGNPYNINPDLARDLDNYVLLMQILIEHASRVYLDDILTNKKDDMYKFTVYKNLEAKYKFVISSTVVKHPPYMVTEGLITYAYDMCEVLFISSEYKFHESTSSWKLVKPSIITQNIFSYSDIKDDKVVKDSDFDIISARLTDITPSTPEIDYIIRQIMINQIKNAIL